MSAFIGTWEEVETTNVDACLKAVDASDELIDLIKGQKSKIEYRLEPDGRMSYAYILGPSKHEATFAYGEEFICPSMTGGTCKTTITKISDNELHCVENGAKFTCSGTMKVEGDKLISAFEVNGIKSVATFKRQA